MGVNDQAVFFDIVPGHMHIAGALQRQLRQIGVWVKTEVTAVDIDVVHIQVQQAIGSLDNGPYKFGFGHFSPRGRDVSGCVFHADAHAQNVLCAGDALGGVAHGFFGLGYRQQVVQVAVVSAPGQVFGEQAHAVFAHEIACAAQQDFIQGAGASQRQRQAVAHKGVALGEGAKIAACTATHASPVFRGHFKKADALRHPLVQSRDQLASKTQTCPWGQRVVVGIGGHVQGAQIRDGVETGQSVPGAHPMAGTTQDTDCPCANGASYFFLSPPHLPSPHLPSLALPLSPPHLPSPHLPSLALVVFLSPPHLPSPHLPSLALVSAWATW